LEAKKREMRRRVKKKEFEDYESFKRESLRFSESRRKKNTRDTWDEKEKEEREKIKEFWLR